MREVNTQPEGWCEAQKRASHEGPWRSKTAVQLAQLRPLTVENGAQKLDCELIVDLEGRQLDAPLPGCVEGDVHADRDRI
eukprot:1702980-Pleurochrysis_carterae.AAC.1